MARSNLMSTRVKSLCGFLIALTALLALGRGPAAGLSPAQNDYGIYLPVALKPAAVAPVIQSFTASPAVIQPGGAATLAWQVTGAASLSISPGIGAVGSASVAVQPAATTTYTLTAANAAGSVQAQATVTVQATPPDGGFFIQPLAEIDRATADPTVKVDAAGGVHVVFTPQSTTPDYPTRPAYYAYCPANCAGPASFDMVALGDGVDFAALALTPTGKPRLLLRVPAQSGAVFVYQYWACDANCLAPGSWTSASLGYSYARQTGWVEPFIHSFALDPQGRPRFVYYDAGADYQDTHWGAFYAWCDSGCADPANWYETRLLEDSDASDFHLAFGSAGQPRLAYTTYDSDAISWQVAYAACEQNCGAGGNWSSNVLAGTVSASVSNWATYSLAVTTTGKPRLALYTGTGQGGSLSPNALYYLTCDAANCAQGPVWSAVRLNLPETQGEDGVALALDGQNRPRLAYHAPLAAGFGLRYAWCDANCAASAAAWSSGEVEPSEAANADLPIPPWPGCAFPQCNPPVPPCTMSSWDAGLHPSLALDGAGNARVAYDAFHLQGGACGTFTDARLVRFAGFYRP
jgi:hypothetical protein